MKKQLLLLVCTVLAFYPGLLRSQPTAQYVPGAEGIKGASLPPPGWYLRDYNLFYDANQLNDANGNDTHRKFNVFTYAQVPRVLWITDTKVLGGYLGVDALVPFAYSRLNVAPAGPYDHSHSGVGDAFGEGTWSCHLKQFDLSLGAGFWAPTGGSSQPDSAGTGYWTTMFTAGATWYADAAKTWSLSALSRYEINTQSRDTQDTRGLAYTLEWGAAKTIKTLDLGLVGYYQDKVTSDYGLNPAGLKPFDSVAAIGPEVSMAFPKIMLFTSLRYNYEFLAYNRAQGHTVTLTLTKRF
ncbi:MAG TPA: transporter [Verrucomicrobiae bacterium]|jgi:hypothetical protein